VGAVAQNHINASTTARRQAASRERLALQYRQTVARGHLLAILLSVYACSDSARPQGSSGGEAATPPRSLNGCDRASASELAGASVRLRFGGVLGSAYQTQCVAVSVGTELTFVGNFEQHPLKPGRIVGDEVLVAANNPIRPTSEGSEITFLISNPGTYGFFCDKHVHEDMHGAIFAEGPAPSFAASAPDARVPPGSPDAADPITRPRAPNKPALFWEAQLLASDKATLAPDKRLMRNAFRNTAWQPEQAFPSIPSAVMEVWEVTRYPTDVPATNNHILAAQSLIEASFQAAARNRWFDFSKGMSDGHKRSAGDPNHFTNVEFILDEATLDPERPEVLMYYETPTGNKLTGVMFLARTPDEQGPQVSGPYTRWHYHMWPELTCLLHGILMTTRAPCSDVDEVATYMSPEMMHVWLIDHPNGAFATPMQLEPSLLADLLERRFAERGW